MRAEQLKKAECQRTDAFKLWCWRRLLSVPWTARRSNQSILKEINPEYLLEALMLKLKLQYFGHLMQRADSLEKTLMLGKMEGGRRGGQEEMVGWHHWLSGHVFEYTLGAGEGQGSLQLMGLQRVIYNWATEPQQQWLLNVQLEDRIYHHYISDQSMLFYFSIQSVVAHYIITHIFSLFCPHLLYPLHFIGCWQVPERHFASLFHIIYLLSSPGLLIILSYIIYHLYTLIALSTGHVIDQYYYDMNYP